MARLINNTRRAITLQTRHVVPANGHLDTTNEVIRCPDNWPRLNGLILANDIIAVFDDPPAAATTVADAPAPVTAETAQNDEAAADVPAASKAPRLKP